MENQNIKVSVVTPCYNNSKHIYDTICSVLKQSHKNLELIVIDDHSTDNSVSIIKSINDDRIKLFVNDTNKGAAYCRNLGIRESSGEYIAFLDGDDLWTSSKLEDQLDYMIKNNFLFSCTDYLEIDEDGKELGRLITGPNIVTHKKYLCAGYSGCLTVMYKKSIYPDLQIPNDIKKRNDYALWLKLSYKVECHYFHKPLAFYRRRNKSMSSGNKKNLLKYHRQVFREICGFSRFHAFIQSYINVLFFAYKRLRFVKKVK